MTPRYAILHVPLSECSRASSHVSVKLPLHPRYTYSSHRLALFSVPSSLPIMVPRLRCRCLRLCPGILNWYSPSPKDALFPHCDAEQSPCVLGIRRVKVSKLFARCSHALIQSTEAETLVPEHPNAFSKG
jgi:hypothetical protein